MEHCGNHLIGRPLRPSRAVALLSLSMLFLLIMLSGTLALSISAPATVHEGETLSVSATGNGTVTIARNSVIVASGTGSASANMETNSTSAGIYTFTFSDDTTGESRSIEILDTPLTVTPTAPAGTDITTAAVTFSLQTNWQPELCYVNIDGTSHTLASTAPTSFSGTFPVGEGLHLIEYKCKLGSELASASRSIHVDADAPIVVASSPSGEVLGPYVTLSVDTDEISQCRYGTSDASFDQLPNPMGSSYALRNTVTVDIPQYASYTYFVRCRDVNGNAMSSSHIISFLNKVPPAARIDVDGKEPLKADTYKVTLHSTVPLSAMPSLTYTLQQSGKQQQVALTGSDDLWTGFVMVAPGTEDTVLSFSFSGVSLQGITGTQILEGSLFTVDAKPPAGIDALTVTNSSHEIVLRWFSAQDEDHTSYNIYRADHEGVTYTDLYSTTSAKEFVDKNAVAARYYYYRVAPVDAAGNLGPLSAEVYGSVIDNIVQETMPVADPVVLTRIDEELASVHGALLDANATLKALTEESNPAVLQVIANMQLVADARTAALKLESAQAQLTELRARAPSAQETDAAIAQSRSLVAESRHLLIRKILPLQQTETTQSMDDASTKRYAPYVLLGVNLSESAQAAYVQSATTLQDRATITTSASTFTLYDSSGGVREYTYIKKTIVLQDPANNIMLIEAIPKSVADAASQIQFRKTPVVLEQDPVVQYSYPVLQQESYEYYVERLVSLDEVKNTRTLLYPKVPEVQPAAKQTTSITGNVVSVVPSRDSMLIGIGVLIIIGLGMYYVSLDQKPKYKAAPVHANTTMSIVRKPLAPRKLQASVQTTQRPAQQPFEQRLRPVDQPNASLDMEQAKVQLERAESLINEKRYDDSLATYRMVMRALQQDKGLEEIMHEEVVHVYAKLILFKRLAEARAAAEAKDRDALHAALDEVRRLAVQIGDADTTLMREAKASYAAFVRVLNTLEIERTGKY